MDDHGDEDGRPITPERVEDAEVLTRFFAARDWQKGKISSGVFKSDQVSLYRETYISIDDTVAEHPVLRGSGVARLTAAFVRSDPRGDVEINRSEPPYAHVHVETTTKKCNTTGQAKRLRDEAMRSIVRMPDDVPPGELAE